MCECLRGIFRVTWTPSSDAESDREDSHGNPQARDSPVNNNRRSPPSDRPPFGTHLSTQHSISADEQDSPERIVQKKKLHAELKQVLSQKRSQLRDTQSTLTDMEEPPKTGSKNEVEKENQFSELVEVVVETQAEVGASGYSVVGGGEQGIFIKEVLKDSPAAKHLSLQKGDQLLSARVYFDNVKYEDALKILQCAEPYKVSFFLKRTVPGSEVRIRPGAQNLELRGPKAKMQKMSVKSVKPFKTKKRRGGRFGLKRLKENKKATAQAELDVEGSPGRSDLSPVDVEFVFPKFKMRKGGKATADGSEHLEGVITSTKKKRKIRFLKMKAMDAAVAEGNVNEDVSPHEGEASRAKLKVKTKGPKFGMNFPKIKKSKLDVQSSNDSFEVKEQEAKFKPPSVECDFNMPQDKAETNVPNPEVSVKGKGEGPEIKMPKINLDVSDTMGTVPKFKLPKVRLSCHSDEIDGEARKETDTSENKLKMPKIDIKAPNVDLDLHFPKTKGKAGFKVVEVPDCNVKGTKINTAKPDTSLPVLNLDAKQRFGDDIDRSMDKEHKIFLPKPDIAVPKIETSDVDISLTQGKVKGDGKVNVSKGGKFLLPQVDLSLPKIKTRSVEVNVERPDVKGSKVYTPSLDISLPKDKTEKNTDIEGHSGTGIKFEMPKTDVSLPKVKATEGEIGVEAPQIQGGKLNMPSIEMSFPNRKVKGNTDLDGKKTNLPKFVISSPKIKSSDGEINIDIKDGKFHMPSIDISLPGGRTGGDVTVEGHEGKGRKFEMPKLDVSLPKLKPSGGEVEGPNIKGGKIHMPSIDISLPGGGAGGDVDVAGHAGKGRKFEMPKLDGSLPKLEPSGGEINVEGPNIKGGKIHMPSIDISLPGGGAGGDVDVAGHAGKGRKFEMHKLDVSLPKLKTSGVEINVEGPNIKGGKIHMPSVDISLPAGGTGGDVDVAGHAGKGRQFEMPKLDGSLPKLKTSGVEINVEGPNIKGGKIHMPSIDISLPGGGAGGDINVEGHTGKGRKFEMPKLDISFPKLKPSGDEINIEGPDIKGGKIHMPSIDISLPGGGAGDVDVAGHAGKGRKFEMPKLDGSLPKLKPSGGEYPDIKGGKFHMPSIDTSLPGATEGELDLGDDTKKGLRFQMPTVISIPKIKLTDHELKVWSEKKDIDISVPKLTHDSDIATKATGVKIRDLNVPEVTLGGNIKLPSVKIPTVDISAPKVDLDFTLSKGKGSDRENIELLKAEGGRPSSGASFDVPDVPMKMLKISLPKFGRKLKSGDKLELDSPDLSIDLDMERTSPSVETSKKDTEIIGTAAEIKIKAGGGEITKPEIRVEGPDVKVKSKLKFPKFKTPIPKAKLKDVEMAMPGYVDNKGKVRMPAVEISLPTANIPECEVLLPKTEVDVSEADIRCYEGSLKIPKMPTIGISVPKVDLDVSLPRLKFNESVDSSDLHINSSRGTVNLPHVKIPKVDISLHHGKTGDTDNHEVEIGRKGKIRMPEVEISLPNAKHDTSNADIKGEKLKIPKMSVPSLDISLPHGKITKNDDPDLEFGVKGSKLKMPDIMVPKINVSLPHKSKEESHAPDLELEGGKLKMPTTDISLPKIKSKDIVPEIQPDVGKGKVMIPGIKLPTIDVSFPHGKTEDTNDLELGVCGKEGKFKVPAIKIPKVDVSSQGQPASAEKTEVRRQDGNFQLLKITIPKVDISLPYGKSDDPQASGSVEVEGGQCKMPDIKRPQLAISLPESRTGEFDTKEGESGGGHGKFTMSNVKIPKLDIRMSREADMSDPSTDVSLKDSHKEGKKMRMPNVDLELDLGLSREGKKNKKKNELPDTDLEPAAPKEKIKGPKVKGSKFNIGMPKLKVSGLENDINKSGKMDAKFLKGGTDANLKADLQAPKIPELDFDIETAQANTNNSEEDKKQTGKVKIPKFGIPLPSLSSPEANIRSSQGKGHSINIDSEAEYESPRMPKLTKAVFVMVNPQIENTASIGGEASAEIVDEKHKQPKIKMKPSFGKSPSNEKEKAIYCEDEVETEGKSKTGKLKLPKVTFLSGQRGSFDVTPSGSDDGTGPSLNGDKYEKSMFGKLKMPKVEFFSPYSKDASEEEEMETSLKLRNEASGESKESKESKTISGTMSFPGLRKKTEKDEEVRKINTIVSSKAKTEMLAEREGSESPVPTVSAGFVSVTKSEEREETTWFKVPKVTLSPHSTGILNITPESSPKGCKSSLPCSSEEASGGFYVKMPSVEFLTREMPSEHLITKTEGTLTVVTKTTKYTETKSTSSKQ
ncbi:neuroblast differentiation-associated protein AHNAK-like isoform X2 [Sinocyclocheilus anshuiensis]|uniref:neuroblast differentiation-associated protein AHNAK-like isoform X2 n=1 Tax=Sinocyclocheilus anshuiensis TaxID=1608454 RepID=UPI0007B7F4E6|nr:PREDICTED: neuroblast differentiation-associated protein AHNAK-like isoform X2 [Sinocyclocheilus anshuiensis]